MRFKKLELLGFKSFAEPTEIVFEPGVTAIVGPNGCGKSNIADAIKWVLGEQSARELRGGRMEDVIFSGTDKRDPVHFAEVALTLDNSDHTLEIPYEEVTIARRLFRSGESEYLLNKTPVRLKDIQELLMGSGMGTSAYSLFEQGRMDQIISAKPDERRAIFEEAAGITKFKTQKRQAMRKLAETSDNLDRVNDITVEVRRQIQSIQRQVKKAKTYQEQFEQVKKLEVNVARTKLATLEDDKLESQTTIESLKSEVQGLEAQLQSQEESVQQARAIVAETEEQLSEAREGLLKVSHRQETTERTLKVHQERIKEAEEQRVKIGDEVVQTQQQIQSRKAERAEIEAGLSSSNVQRAQKEQLVEILKGILDQCAIALETISTEGQAIREQLQLQNNTQEQAQKTYATVREEFAHMQARSHQLEEASQKVAAERQELLSKVELLASDTAQARQQLEQAQQAKQSATAQLQANNQAVETAHSQVRDLEHELARLSSQQEILQGVLQSHEGYSGGVKTLLTGFDEGVLEKTGVYGVLAELLEVDPEDMAAVDAALGSWSEALVVDSAAVAERCRGYLEAQQAGRVRFVLLDQWKIAGEPAPSPWRMEDKATRLRERVSIAQPLLPVIENLLQDAWLVSDRGTAQALLEYVDSTQAPETLRLVTPEGELYASNMSLLGKVPNEEALLVGRTSRLKNLDAQLMQLHARLEETRDAVSLAVQKRDNQQHQLETLDKAYQEAVQSLERVQATHVTERSTLERLDQKRDQVQTERQNIAADLERLRVQQQQSQVELEQAQTTLQTVEAKLKTHQEEAQVVQQAREETSVTLASERAELEAFDAVLTSRRASLEVLTQSITTATEQIAAREEETQHLSDQVKTWQQSSDELAGILKELVTELQTAQAQVDEVQQRRTQVAQEAQTQEDQLEVLRRRTEQLQRKQHKQEMSQAQLEFNRDQIVDRLQQIYQINLDQWIYAETYGRPQEQPWAEYTHAATPYDWVTHPLEAVAVVAVAEGDGFEPLSEEVLVETQAQIDQISQKLNRMGPVNLASIDEERELQERYDYLMGQQEDLQKAKEDLQQVLNKIRRTTKTMFEETFYAIQKEFEVSFKQLFGGGKAQLVLLNEEDILESGVEIIARPPGKQLQAISLMSGGEKALTSIALLFAIFRIKPSPFCLLDEIDAPLDESNVTRFAEAIRAFLKDSQFIVITHNKKTISMSDIMYGITMEERGVSRVVSVKLNEANEHQQIPQAV